MSTNLSETQFPLSVRRPCEGAVPQSHFLRVFSLKCPLRETFPKHMSLLNTTYFTCLAGPFSPTRLTSPGRQGIVPPDRCYISSAYNRSWHMVTTRRVYLTVGPGQWCAGRRLLTSSLREGWGPWFAVSDNFQGENIPIVADFQVSMWHY